MNNIKNPLILDHRGFGAHWANKSGNQAGAYVDLKLAKEMLNLLIKLREEIMYLGFSTKEIQLMISKATGNED